MKATITRSAGLRGTRGGIAAFALFVGLGLAELAVRVLDPLGVSYFDQVTAYQLDKVADPELVFRHRPLSQRRYGGVLVTTNEHGLRDRPIGEKADGELRILALGDSVTFGWGVPREATFAARLEPLLSARLHRPVRTINAGVGSYNTVQEVAWFRRDGLALHPDLVLLTYLENDTEVNEGPYDPGAAVTVAGRAPLDAALVLLRRSRLYQLAVYAYRCARPSAAPAAAADDRGWSASMSALGDLAAQCDAQHVPLMIFFFRWGRHSSDALYADVVRHARGHPVRDIGAWWGDQRVRELMRSKIDTHPNAAGHRLIAARMAADVADYLGASGR